MNENKIGDLIIQAGFKIHSSLGAGLLESIYEKCLQHELSKSGIIVKCQVPMPVIYENIKMDCGYRVDLWVDNKVIVEIKSADSIHPIHLAQIMTYLKLSGNKLGYILNFNEPHFKNGIKRVVMGKL